MPPRLLVLSRARAEAYEPRESEVCISITAPHDSPVRLSPKFKSVLRLTFSDTVGNTRTQFPWDVLFAAEHATHIIEFISRWRDVDQVVIHCMAGRSRSPGVALGICDLQGWPVQTLERERPLWNTWVRQELVRTGSGIAWPIMQPNPDNLLEQLASPSRVWARAEVLSRPSPVPAARGLYAWFFDNVPPKVPLKGVTAYQGLRLLYVGIAPRRIGSKATLRSRMRQHFASNAAGSPLRLTLGCLLAEELGIHLHRAGTTHRLTFGKEGEESLSEWMDRNALVCWIEHPKPWKVEQQILEALRPPLNIEENAAHPFCRPLSALRSEMRKKAREA
jgi:hypothetical protein